MGNPAERIQNDTHVDAVVDIAANGNEDARKYLADIAFVSRIMDDLVDKDYSVPDTNIYRAYFILLVELYQNPFFMANRHTLVGLHIAAFNAWMDANRMEKQAELPRLYAHVLKDFINEICPTVAFLTGGHDLMREVSGKMRNLFMKEVK